MRGHEKIKEQLLDELGGLGRNSKQKERNPISWGGLPGELHEIGGSMDGYPDWYEELEKEVKDRTARLNELNRELTEEMARLKEAEKALAGENQEWVRIFNATSSLIMILDDQYRILRANKAMGDALGITEEEAIGQTCFELVHGEKEPPHFCPHVHLLVDGKEHSAEVFAPRIGGVYDVTVFPLLVQDGQRLKSLHVARDITEKKRAEEKIQQQSEFLRTILTSLTHPFYVINADDYTIEIANRSAGLSDVAIGQKCYTATHGRTSPCSGADHPCPLMEVKKTGRPLVVEHIHHDHEGNPRNVEIHAYPIKSAEGDVVKVIEYALDITERKKAEEALRESEERFKQVADNAGEWIWEADANGMYRYCSSAVERILGYSPDELVGRKYFYDLFPPEVREDLKKEALGIFERKKKFRAFVNPNLHKDGSIIMLETSGSPVQDEQGTLLGYRGTDTDVTERKRAEEALRESEERLRLFIEHAPTALAMFDSEMRYLGASRRWIKEYRLDDRPIIGRSHYETSRWIPDSWKAVHRRGLEGEVVRADEDFIELKRGAAQWRRWEVRPWYTAEGGIGGIVIFAEDITERKQAEEAMLRSEKKYRTLFDESRDGVYAISRDGEITDANQSLSEILGYPKEELIGKDGRELYVDPADRPAFQEAIEKSGFVKDYEIKLRKADGTEFDCLVTASVQFGDDGSIVGYRGIMRDLTIRKRLQSQLFQAQKMEAIGTLAGGIAHDFNNLLQIIMGYSDMLIEKKGKESPDLRYLETMRKAAKDGRVLVKGLLTFSRQAKSNVRSVELNKQLKRVKSILERMLPRMIEIELILTDDLAALNADPIQVDQVLMNLAINAHHAMPQGGKLTIEARNVTLDEDYCRTNVEAKPGEYVMLKISDTGHGMEKEVLDRIFEPFFTTKEADVGTGLGLSIVYGIVKNHRGHITCSSGPGLGTTFSIYLPAVPGESNLDMAMTKGEMPAFGTEVILLVDDEEPIRNVVAQILTPLGYKLFTAENGNEALEIYGEKKNEIDLVVLDLNMPGMGGKQCLEEILKIDPKARVLIASGYSINKSTKKFLEFRASGFIGKPFDARELLRVVRRVLDKPGSLRSPVSGSGPVSVGSAEGEGPPRQHPPLVEASPEHEAPDIEELPWRLRILAIDDREPYLRMLEAGLAQFGQTPLTASSGIEGLQMFQETPVDVVVCDLGMPELDGWAVGKRIKEICQEKEVPKTPFVLLTGQADMEGPDQEAREKMDDCGVDAIVGKPVDIPDLLEIIENLMEKSYGGKE